MHVKKYVVFVCLVIGQTGAFAQESYNDSMFARALKNDSTSHPFVLVSVKSRNSERTVCLPANIFLGALRAEYGGPASDARMGELITIAIRSRKKGFIFQNPRAQRNAHPDYTVAQFEEVRTRLSGLSKPKLKAQIYDQHSPIHEMYRTRQATEWNAYRNAIAHELLLRGIPVGIEDMTGRLYIP